MSGAKVPEGTYTDGYDAGLRDAKAGVVRAIPKLKRRSSATTAAWARYRVGYDDGYFDGLIVRARRVPA